MAQERYWDGTKWVPISAAHEEFAIHTAGGTANAITVATEAGYSYGQHKQLHFKATLNNTGNVTINVDGKGAKPALKFDGTQLPANAIKKDKIYDFYYDTASGGRFFLIAKASGNSVVGDVLAGKTFSNDDGELVGTMVNHFAFMRSITAEYGTIAIPQGYHNGSGYVQAAYPKGLQRAEGTVANADVFPNEIMVLGLAFSPRYIFLEHKDTSNQTYRFTYSIDTLSPHLDKMYLRASSSGGGNMGIGQPPAIYSNGFAYYPQLGAGKTWNWVALG